MENTGGYGGQGQNADGEGYQARASGPDIVKMKRALAGDTSEYFDKMVMGPDFPTNCDSHEKIRLLIRKFFFDLTKMNTWLITVDQDEIKYKSDKNNYQPFWKKQDWLNEFRNQLLLQYTQKIQAMMDDFIKMADMYGGNRAQDVELTPMSWAELFKKG